MKSLVVLLVVCSAFAGVHSFFGKQVVVPNFETQLIAAWGSGTTQIGQLDDLMLTKIPQDGLGTFAVVQPIMLTISQSVNDLITKIVDDIVTQDGNTIALLEALRRDIRTIVGSITVAKDAIKAISGIKISATIAGGFHDNFTKLTTEVSSLLIILDEFELFAMSVDNANPDPNIEQEANNLVNIATVIATVRKFRHIRMAFNGIATNLASLVQARMTAIDQQTSENATIFKNEAILSTDLATNFNQSTSGVLAALLLKSQTQTQSINDSFNAITLNPSLYNQADIANLTAYLGNLTNTLNNCYGSRMPNLTQELQEEVTYVMGRKVHKLANYLIEMVINVTDSASISSSPYASTCSTGFSSAMENAPANMLLLQDCINPEKPLIYDIFQEATNILNSIVKYAIAPNGQVAMCSSKTGACARKIFASLPHYNDEMRSFISRSMKGIAEELELSMVRMEVCVRAVADDIQEYAERQRANFNSCLITGH